MNFEIIRPSFSDKEFNILDFGAKSSLNYNNQYSIQLAIDTCSNNGGGKVIIPDGYYYTGPIKLKSNVNLYVSENAFVKFSKSKEEYPLIWTEYEGIRRIRTISPISAVDCENIAITGKGVLDGAGDLWRGIKQFKLTAKEWQRCLKKSQYVVETKEGGIWCPTKTYYDGVINGEPDYNDPKALEIASQCWDVYRPVFVSLINCDKVLIQGVTLKNSPAWNIHPLYCRNFTLEDAIVKNKFSAQNGDVIDLESCQNCEISRTIFEVGDDGICIKSGKNKEARQKKIPTKNVWIHDCKVYDAHGGFVVGSEMSRGVENILVENCVFIGTDIGIRFKSALGRGGIVQNITIKNIYMGEIVEEAMIFTMGYVLVNIEDNKETAIKKIDADDIPEFKNIYIDNVICNSSKTALKVQGLKELPIHDIFISNSQFKADKDMELALCKNISFNNVDIVLEDGNHHIDKKVLEAL